MEALGLFRSESNDCQSVGADRFVEWAPLHELLSSGAVALLKGSWLLEFAESQELLPRRQDLPCDSFWQPDELFELSRLGCLELRRGHEIIAISHSWLSAEHPDPDRSQTDKLGRYVKAWSNTQSGLLPSRIAIFVDWCSLMQEPRTPAESGLFLRAQENAHIWYAHRHVRVMLLTSVPEAPSGAQSAKPYHRRGWPCFEMALAGLNVHWGGDVLDMGRCESGARHLERGWPCTNAAMSALVSANNAALDAPSFQICGLPRRPPSTVKMFERILDNKLFADRSDIDTLMRQYTMTFGAFAASIEVLDFSGLDWDDREAETVADALPSFTRLQELNLSRNKITEIGAGFLSEEVSRCPSLSKLLLVENEITEGSEGAVRLRDAWTEARKNYPGLLMSFPEHSEFVRRKIGLE